ncbi:MAG: transposase [Hyphomonadaceae bacterium]|nr:transposase [Hyphomonadaceae bacterium]
MTSWIPPPERPRGATRRTRADKCAASLAGLAPMARDSGQWKGKRFIRGGRAALRHAKYQALTAAGKAPKVALVAVMRKLIVLANALLKDARPWEPKLA